MPYSEAPSGVSVTAHESTASANKRKTVRNIGVKKRRSVENAIFHLPTIDTYQKELIFPADGPGRVVAKIERLMGSDKIHYFDREWMGEFSRVLDIDDARDLVEKSKMRAHNERERSKKLALEMAMIPTSDMDDIKKHPLFKVNFIMKRLEKMNIAEILTGSKKKLPRITATEPFAEDFSGKVFESYPGHAKYDGGTEAMLLYKNAEIIPSATNAASDSGMLVVESKPSHQDTPEEEDEDEEYEEEEGSIGLTGEDDEGLKVRSVGMRESLVQLMEQYNAETKDDIFALYAPCRSDVVQELFASEDSMQQMYERGKDISMLYRREVLKTEKELKALHRTLAGKD